MGFISLYYSKSLFPGDSAATGSNSIDTIPGNSWHWEHDPQGCNSLWKAGLMPSPQSMSLMGMCGLASDRLSPESSQILWSCLQEQKAPIPKLSSFLEFQEGRFRLQVGLESPDSKLSMNKAGILTQPGFIWDAGYCHNIPPSPEVCVPWDSVWMETRGNMLVDNVHSMKSVWNSRIPFQTLSHSSTSPGSEF